MYLVVGLGNPGEKYQNTRHNIGFKVIDNIFDKLSKQQKIVWKTESSNLVSNVQISNKKTLLSKPQLFMNNSGTAVKNMIKKHDQKIKDIIVIHDEIDLPFNQVRVQKGGGSAGQKGIESIIDSIGSKDFIRIRIGVDKPEHKYEIENYVLQDFTKQEQKTLPNVIKTATQKTLLLIKHDYDHFISKYN